LQGQPDQSVANLSPSLGPLILIPIVFVYSALKYLYSNQDPTVIKKSKTFYYKKDIHWKFSFKKKIKKYVFMANNAGNNHTNALYAKGVSELCSRSESQPYSGTPYIPV
jgi:hypothetical protein